ncbi:MAG: hypothetical protein ABR941_11915 [Thermoleophilia bacterium]
MEDPELEYYRDGCLAERQRADEAENELEQIREAMGALDDADLVSLAAILRRHKELCAAGHAELQHRLLRTEAMLYLAWTNTVEATGRPYESWLETLEKQMAETI